MSKFFVLGAVFIIVAVTGALITFAQIQKNNRNNDPLFEKPTPPPPPPILPSSRPETPPPPPAQSPPAVTPNPPAKAPPPVAPLPPPPPATQERNFSVSVDDYSATPSSFMVNKGDKVNLTVNVKTTDVYYGGIQLKSSVVTSGSIPPGGSEKLTFTANSSFDLIPYWPASGVRKDYTIKIIAN